jgi:hypothetical protein
MNKRRKILREQISMFGNQSFAPWDEKKGMIESGELWDGHCGY